MHEETELGGLGGRPSLQVPASQTLRLQPHEVSRPVSSQTCPHVVSEALRKGRGPDKENGLCSLRDMGWKPGPTCWPVCDLKLAAHAVPRLPRVSGRMDTGPAWA